MRDAYTLGFELGCKGLVINSRPPPYHSPSHKDLDPLWALAQEAGVPILFHVGGEKKMDKAYLENGGPQILDFHGGAENFTGVITNPEVFGLVRKASGL